MTDSLLPSPGSQEPNSSKQTCRKTPFPPLNHRLNLLKNRYLLSPKEYTVIRSVWGASKSLTLGGSCHKVANL